MAIAFLLFMIVIGPFLTIWAVNTLFPIAAIPYTWETWVAVILVGAFIRAKVSVTK
jgi:hypothetical protein